MLINADLAEPAIVRSDHYEWSPSPQKGVERMMLDRIGEEKARATTIVRYQEGSSFPLHPHPGGEEIFVLDGTFCDETGSFPKGTYIRNPPNSVHSPFCPDGATIFVKLRQMHDTENHFLRVDTLDPDNWVNHQNGRNECLLHQDEHEFVSLQILRPQSIFNAPVGALVEWLIIKGEVFFSGEVHAAGSWIRLPKGSLKQLMTKDQGSCFYQKVVKA
ncbi:cupin domain-containing protein [Marinomonas communis]|uniref:cupin domain-containing protein n=1 Tax=Marinomonas communis TaxID=28254 RepID=UPI001002244B|nr:cupin domain-containing protein [Marinomonas communis]MCC4273799.1 cupin domain-containing protein [Marinomonas communis]RUM55696.1 MAG: anti-sigma factor [Marinomonas sp.]